MKDALLEREDCNVILVDWSKGAGSGPLDYAQASGNARLVGAQTAVLIKFLISSATGSSGSKNLGKRFYIVGFSLGAHVAGYAGRHLQANNGIKLGRITGNTLRWLNTVLDTCVSFTFFSITLNLSVAKNGSKQANNTNFGFLMFKLTYVPLPWQHE